MSEIKKGNYLLEILVSVFVSVVLSLLLIVIAAFVIKFFNIDSDAIIIINQIIKCLAITVSSLICLKLPNNGWIRGFIVGTLYTVVAFVVFSLLNGSFVLGLSLLNDLVFGGITGMISGIVAVNIRHK